LQLHQPKLAEMVAGALRDRIVSGELADGAVLPRQDDLIDEFHVSKPSLREALRILEAEGLLTVRRGVQGGAIVHVPQAQNAARTIALVLHSRNVRSADVAEALKTIEPLCAGMLGARPDRHEAVLPNLRNIHEQLIRAIDNVDEFVKLSRRFHEQLVASCSNETLVLIVGALELVWTDRQRVVWSDRKKAFGGRTERLPDRAELEKGVRAHERILELIERGDVDLVQRQVRRHLDASLFFFITEPDEGSVI